MSETYLASDRLHVKKKSTLARISDCICWRGFLTVYDEYKFCKIVAYFAEQFHLSSGYFGDVIKRETSISPQEFIENKLIDLAKEHFFDNERSISEIAYELGFRYPQYLTRLFKKKVGRTPQEYRIQK